MHVFAVVVTLKVYAVDVAHNGIMIHAESAGKQFLRYDVKIGAAF
jgi:hypothetical protein